MGANNRKKPIPKKVHAITPAEEPVLRAYVERVNARLAPRLKVQNKDGVKIAYDHPEEAVAMALLASELGAVDGDFYYGLIQQLANVGSQRGKVDEGHSTSFSQSSRTSSRDQIEAMLASQMAAVHIAAMTFARRLANVDTISQQDSAERAFTKLLRTFATQMEALKRYRTGGEQKVTVQHVSVGEGGQAIVGNVNQAPREGPPSKATAPAALNDSSSTAMPIIQAKQRTDVRKRRGK